MQQAISARDRVAAGPARILPDFIVIGAMRAGTTSLHDFLARHPDVGMPREKEVDFFVSAKWSRGIDWYSSQWSGGRRHYGEISPNYSKVDVFPGVARRIAGLLPNVKIVYVVRDPVERFVSQYRHMKARGFRLPDPLALCTGEPPLPAEPTRLGHGEPYRHILSVSAYARQLAQYLAVLPREQILVVDFGELLAEPERVLAGLQSFLDLSPVPGVLPERNRSRELSRVPRPLLRFARDTTVGRQMTRALSGRSRDRLKRSLALPFLDAGDAFPVAAIDRIKSDLAGDVAAFRAMTGRAFAGWSL